MDINFNPGNIYFEKFWLFLARGGGLGFLPLMPGTWGSLGGLILFVFLHFLFAQFQLWLFFFVVLLILVALFAAAAGIEHYNQPDPAPVVIDEIAGQFLTLYPLYWSFIWPTYWQGYLLGFIFFRFYDALKIFPVNIAENLPGPWGVVVDDLVAGIMANFTLIFIGYSIYQVGPA